MEVLEIEIYKHYMDVLGLKKVECVEPRKVRLSEIIELYDCFCFDGYGTLYNRGSFVYPGAEEWYRMLRQANKQMRLITNAASDVDSVLAADAGKRGFYFSEQETISSGSLLKNLVEQLRCVKGNVTARRVRQVFYIGRETGKNVLAACGVEAVENPEEPVVAVSSAKDTPESYAHAVEILKRPGSVLLVLNSDAWAPKIDGTREPVSGALSERLRRDSMDSINEGKGCETYYLGKPFTAIWDKVKKTLPQESRVLMIGDTLGTDVLGARIAGFDSALIVGRNQPAAELQDDEATLGIRPNYYLI